MKESKVILHLRAIRISVVAEGAVVDWAFLILVGHVQTLLFKLAAVVLGLEGSTVDGCIPPLFVPSLVLEHANWQALIETSTAWKV